MGYSNALVWAHEPLTGWDVIRATDHSVIAQECTNKGRTLLIDKIMKKYIDAEKAIEVLKKINVLMKQQHRSYFSDELEHIIKFIESNKKNG